MKVYIAGSGVTKFGELWDVSPRTLAQKAVTDALAEAGLDKGDIDALFVGNMLSGILGGQEHLGAFFAEELGLRVPAIKVEGACASGGLAVHAAVSSILSGQYRRALVLGIEKMTDYKPEEVALALMGAGSDEERAAGATFPGLYACLANAHMRKFGTTEHDLAEVAVKNHFHASLNPDAQYRTLLTVDRVLKSTRIADPLKLYDCSPISDGAAAVIISADTPKGAAVRVISTQVATDTLGLSGRKSLTELSATRKAARKAYAQAGIRPSDIRAAEVHDCFTIAEILAMEDLGFYGKGKAAVALSQKKTTLGADADVVVNTSGGLKACGHPVGATGVKQVAEISRQLSGRAGKRQVDGLAYGLTHNVGGSGGTAVVHILTNTT
jgi:acetyl-CoA C-acetyltransferase